MPYNFKQFCTEFTTAINDNKKFEKIFLAKFKVDFALFKKLDTHASKRMSTRLSMIDEKNERTKIESEISAEASEYQRILMSYVSGLMAKANPQKNNWQKVKNNLLKAEKKLNKEVDLFDISEEISNKITELEANAGKALDFFDDISNAQDFIDMIIKLGRIDTFDKAIEFKNNIASRKRSNSSFGKLLFAKTPFTQPQELVEKMEKDLTALQFRVDSEFVINSSRKIWLNKIDNFLKNSDEHQSLQIQSKLWEITKKINTHEGYFKETKAEVNNLVGAVVLTNQAQETVEEGKSKLLDYQLELQSKELAEAKSKLAEHQNTLNDLNNEKLVLEKLVNQKTKTSKTFFYQETSGKLVAYTSTKINIKEVFIKQDEIIDSFIASAEKNQPEKLAEIKMEVQQTLLQQLKDEKDLPELLHVTLLEDFAVMKNKVLAALEPNSEVNASSSSWFRATLGKFS